MEILTHQILLADIENRDDNPFEDMIKAVADIDKRLIAIGGELHSDLEQMLLDNGSDQKNLYGFNIYFDGEIEYDSMINPPRNREAGYPRVGRYVADPVAREKIKEVVDEWIVQQ